MEHCGQKTKLVLSSTCRQLRKLSWMAYHHPVVLTTPETIYPFALFTFARLAMDRPCFYKLHELVVSLSFMTDQNRDYVDVFSRTLVYYDLLGLYLFQPELALFQHSDLFVTIAAQRKLTSLFIIGDIGPRTCQLMRAIESDLRVVELVQEGAYSDDDVVEVGQSLSPHADTLEWVTIAAGSILVAIDISDGMSTGIGPFPNMHTFALSDPGMVTDSASIMEIIPNLRILDVGAGWTVQSGWLPPSDIIDCAKERRSISKMDSREMSKDFTAARTTPPRWQNLELVRGGLWDLVWFGNTCRCKTLEITMVIPEYIVDQHRWLSVVVGDHAPEVLRFPLFVPFKVAHFRAATRRFSSIKSLYLCIKPVKTPANDGRFYVSLVRHSSNRQRTLTHLVSNRKSSKNYSASSGTCDVCTSTPRSCLRRSSTSPGALPAPRPLSFSGSAGLTPCPMPSTTVSGASRVRTRRLAYLVTSTSSLSTPGRKCSKRTGCSLTCTACKVVVIVYARSNSIDTYWSPFPRPPLRRCAPVTIATDVPCRHL